MPSTDEGVDPIIGTLKQIEDRAKHEREYIISTCATKLHNADALHSERVCSLQQRVLELEAENAAHISNVSELQEVCQRACAFGESSKVHVTDLEAKNTQLSRLCQFYHTQILSKLGGDTDMGIDIAKLSIEEQEEWFGSVIDQHLTQIRIQLFNEWVELQDAALEQVEAETGRKSCEWAKRFRAILYSDEPDEDTVDNEQLVQNMLMDLYSFQAHEDDSSGSEPN